MLTSTTRSLTAPTSSSIDAGALNASLPTESTAATAYVITPRGGESLTGVTAVRAVISTPLRYILYRTGVSPPEGCCQVICTPAKASWTTTLAGVQITWQQPDRKSTRLNSSHLGISYAVF